MDRSAVLVLVAMFLLVSHIHGGLKAYLDPNTGSMALQLVLAGVVALLATLRGYRERIRAFFVRRQAPPSDAPTTTERR
jgi:hypothetical protein